MKKIIRLLFCAVTALLVLTLTGCESMSVDDLYALPLLSEGYLQLQSAIDEVLNSGAEYASPTSGANRQPIQREDIDGDGVREVIAFFNFTGSDKPLKICVFKADANGMYSEAARIEGEGTGIDTINYLDMDRDGTREIAVGWQIGSGINMLSVYSMKGYQVNQILNTNYTEYIVCGLNPDTGSDLVALRLSPSEQTGEAELYSLTADGEVVSSTTRLSSGLEALLRVRSTTLLAGSGAVLLEGSLGGGIVSELLVAWDGRLVNITLDESTGVSEETLRTYSVYCRDINGDGVLDVPNPVALPATSESTTYYMIEWYSYMASGGRRLVTTTYNNYSDSWYLELPDEWIGRIAVRREDGSTGERRIVFSTVGAQGERDRDFLIIYTLTGENRVERAASAGRFVLREEEETIYSAAILGGETAGLPIDQTLVRERFGVIYSEWITGET